MRINKYIAQSGEYSRRQADALIESGKVLINGVRAQLGDQVLDGDIIKVNNKAIDRTMVEPVYLVYHKPVGIICTSDKNAKDTIDEAIKFPTRIFPVGRLDVGTSGLMLLTNDGSIVNTLLKGENEVEKEYEVVVDQEFPESTAQTMKSGIFIEGYKTRPAKFVLLTPTKARITVVEGKNRLIRRLCEACGVQVKTLQRVRIGDLKLDKLKRGEYYEISKNKLSRLLGVEL